MFGLNRFSYLLVLSGVLAVGLQVNSLQAQSTRTMDAAARRIDDFRKQNEKAIHDGMTKDMNGRKVAPEELKRAAAVRQQLKEDFEALQQEYNGLVTRLKSREQISTNETNEIGGRVHERSTRLLRNLNLPETPPNDQSPDPKASDASLKSLTLKIFAFITHPMFETPSAIDVKASAEARVVLEEIIAISDTLRQAK